jgi:hypothetical protein
MPRNRLETSVAAFALCAWIAAGCAHAPWAEKAPESAEVTQEISASATVVAVDPATRLITLRDDQGGTLTVQAGPQVRNFAQIEAGDAVNVRYVESLAVALAKPGEAAAPSAEIVASRAKPGEKPGAVVGGQVTTTVRVELVDTKTNIVVFTPPGGGLRAIRVVRPEGQRFIKGLEPGDQVQITYTEALAVSVDER